MNERFEITGIKIEYPDKKTEHCFMKNKEYTNDIERYKKFIKNLFGAKYVFLHYIDKQFKNVSK